MNHTIKDSNKPHEEYVEKHIFRIYINGSLIKTMELKNEEKVLYVGKSDECDVVVNSPIVSGKHFKIMARGNKCFIEDLGSTNYTYVNKRKIEAAYCLVNGDNIVIDNIQQSRDDGVLIEYVQKLKNTVVADQMTYSLKGKTKVVVGRQEGCDIVITHTKISRQHFRIVNTAKGWVIEDLNSTNGTYLNGKRIKNRILLSDNDSIFVINTKFTYRQNEIRYSIIENGLAIDAVDISKVIKDNDRTKTIVDKVSISIKPGEFVAIDRKSVV